ncbi:MAG TPA: cyclic pyranopterin monophosphate synthase MoaC [Polyangiaceae bacterium]
MVGHSAFSTHLGPAGGARMVDVSQKSASHRHAVAESRVSMSADAFARVKTATVPKGDVLGTARLAGIMAAKRTAELIPLCHPLALTKLELTLELDDAASAIGVRATVEAFDRTGVEMEALTAVSVAALTVYDMLKGIDRAMEIGPTRLVAKSGGRSGDFKR